MALKQVVLSRKIADRRAALKLLTDKRDELAEKKAAIKTREVELEEAVNEITDETSQEDRDALDHEVCAFEAEAEALEGEIAANEAAIGELETAMNAPHDFLDDGRHRDRLGYCFDWPSEGRRNGDQEDDDLPFGHHGAPRHSCCNAAWCWQGP